MIFIIPMVFISMLVVFAFMCVPLALMFASWYMRVWERKLQRRKRDGANVAIFHPYCNAGGGGERVLWVAIRALLTRYPDTTIYIYTIEQAELKSILDKAQNTFNVRVDPEKIRLVRLSSSKLIEATTYPYFTLLGQSLGSMVLGLEAFMKLNPDVYIDTTGCAFTYPIFRYLAQCPVACYTHYPTVTRAMMRRVKHRVVAYNNAGAIARNPVFTWLKLLYYKIFGWIPCLTRAIMRCVKYRVVAYNNAVAIARNPDFTWLKLLYYKIFTWLYSVAGRCADVVMVNGTWTEEHITELWRVPLATHRVYPPCEVSQLKQLRSLVKDTDPIRILSVAQFRPEKDHPLMLQAMYELRNLLVKNEALWSKIKLVLVGSCRNAEDEERVKNLKDLAKHLSLEDSVQFIVNAPFATLLREYQTCSIALHAMWNEHFGISVVECMAAGLVTIAHRSGGPRADIISEGGASRTGYLAAEPEEYARAVLEVIALTAEQRGDVVDAARASVDRFSEKEFEKSFLRAVESVMIVP